MELESERKNVALGLRNTIFLSDFLSRLFYVKTTDTRGSGLVVKSVHLAKSSKNHWCKKEIGCIFYEIHGGEYIISNNKYQVSIYLMTVPRSDRGDPAPNKKLNLFNSEMTFPGFS